MFKKDSLIFGLLIGVILPLAVYAMAIVTLSRYGHVDGFIYTIRPKVPALLAAAANLFPFRFFMVNKKFDKTGRGILLVTFLMVILIFALF